MIPTIQPDKQRFNQRKWATPGFDSLGIPARIAAPMHHPTLLFLPALGELGPGSAKTVAIGGLLSDATPYRRRSMGS